MNLAIKRRTIGVIILIIIFVWIGLMLYRHRHTDVSTINEASSMPQAPNVPANIQQEVESLPQQQITVISAAPVKTSTMPSTNAQTRSEPKLPAAWVIQLGTFSKEQNAQNLLSKVRHQGYDAYSQTVMSNGKKMTKVFVGPNISYEGIHHAQEDLEKRYHLHGVIQSYHVKLPS
jgi:DedD protein